MAESCIRCLSPLVATILLVAAVGCEPTNNTYPPLAAAVGGVDGIAGRVTHRDGATLVAGADVTATGPATYTARSGSDASFASDFTYAEDPTVVANLQAYVNRGGYLYASDWDFAYVDAAWPGAVTYHDPPTVGSIQDVTADIVDTEVAGYLRKQTAEIAFDLPEWVVMTGVGPATQVLVSGSVDTTAGTLSDVPLMVSYESGAGIVAYTSFHNAAQLSHDVRKLLISFIALTQN